MGNGLIAPDEWKPIGIAGLEDAAMAAVKATGNTLVTAGPGAGKTELLGQRGVFLLQTGRCPHPRRILAISFKKDAARNLRERFERRCTREQAARLDSLTFDAFAKQLFDRFSRALPPEWALKAPYRIAFSPSRNEVVDFQRTVAANLSNPATMAGKAHQMIGSPLSSNDVMAMSYEEFGNGIQQLSLAPFAVDTVGSFAQLVRVMWALDQNPPLLTFPMISRLLQVVLEQNPRVARALRATYSHVFMDEFQDTTYVQYELMRSIFGGSDTVITAVGDDKQKIMGWAGAHGDSFGEFTTDFLAGGAASGQSRLTLSFNYRSNARIVDILNTLKQRLAPNEPDFQAVRPTPALPSEQICAVVRSPSEAQENQGIADYANNRIKAGQQPREIALLVRQKAKGWEERLLPSFANLGLGLRNEDRNVDGASIQDLMTEPYARFIVDALDYLGSTRGGVVWTRLVDALMMVEGIDDDDEGRTRRVIDPLDQFKRRAQFDGAEAADEAGLNLKIAAIEKFARIERLIAMAPHYQQADYFQDIRRATRSFLLECIAGRSWRDAVSWFRGEGQVPLLTITKSKGLEYETVILLGLDDSQWWSFKGNPTEGHANFFVAASRAKNQLFLMFCDGQQVKQIGEIYQLLQTANVPLLSVADWVRAPA